MTLSERVTTAMTTRQQHRQGLVERIGVLDQEIAALQQLQSDLQTPLVRVALVNKILDLVEKG